MRKFICFLFACVLGTQAGFSEEEHLKPSTICLNMIVKNEIKVIERCLNSVKPYIDTWVIVDTGSTDGTQDLIKKTLSDIPGELFERPWVNFGHNREEALRLAEGKADYVLFIDADEKLAFSPDFQKTHLNKDYYFINFSDADDDLLFTKVLLINMKRDWRWQGVIHEELKSETAKTFSHIPTIQCIRHTSSSARSQDPEKYRKDARLLEEALKTEPDNSRYVFYLAQSYGNAGERQLALENYQKRSTMGGWDQEVFWSMLMAAKLQEELKYPAETVVKSFTKVYQYRPDRAESLFYLARHYLKEQNIVAAYALAKLAAPLPYPPDSGYVEGFVYHYAAKYTVAACAEFLGKYEEAIKGYEEVLQVKSLPLNSKTAIENSLKMCFEKRGK